MSYWPFNAKAVKVVPLAIALMAMAILALPGGPLYAQEGIVTIYHAENDEDPVTELSARDPEGVMPPMIWSLLESHETDDNMAIEVDGTALTADDVEDHASFEISESGELIFEIGVDKDPPDWEDPADVGENNEYRVVVQASDGGKAQKVSHLKVVVVVTDEEETGKVKWTVDPDGTGNDESPQTLRQFQDGAALVARVEDPDRATEDADDDAIPPADITSWKWYRGSDVITGQNRPSYDVTTADVGKRIKVVATYTDRRGTGKSAELTSSHLVKQARVNNADPEFSPSAVTRTVPENTAAGMDIGSPVTAMDDDDTVLTYSLDGEDAESFDIDPANGQLMTKADLDYETKSSYEVEVTATDPSGADTEPVATVAITVIEVNEKPMFRSGTKGMLPDHTEGTTDFEPVPTYTAFDPEGGTVTLSLSGDDEDMFMLDDVSGTCPAVPPIPTGTTATCKTLSLQAKPDFEMPGDDNGDNVYEVMVVASDSSNDAMRSVTVKVTDMEEPGKVTLSPQDARIGTPIMAELEDSDGGVTDIEWQWHRIDATGNIPELNDTNEIDDATDATYTPDDDDNNMRLMVMASYTDRTYAGTPDPLAADDDATAMMFTNTARSMATTAVRDDPANKAPEFKDSAAQRFVLENTDARMAIGMPVTAKENDTGQTLTYSLSGADRAAFDIDAVDDPAATPAAEVAGQIKTKADLNYEDKKRYTVTVTATDSSGESNDSDTITVTIHVIDVDEGPEIDGPTTTVDHVENDEGVVTRLSARDPEGVMPPMIWSRVTDATVSEDIDADDILDVEDFKITDSGMLMFAIGDDEDPPDFEDPQDSNQDNEYRVAVQASDGGRTQAVSYFKVVVVVTDEEETGKVKWTVDPDGTGNDESPQTLRQFQDGAALVARVEDPDRATEDADDDAIPPAGITWKWYRGSAVIQEATGASYTVKPADVGSRIKAVASYTDRRGSTNERGRPKSAELVSSHQVKEAFANNADPEFSPRAVTRTVPENTAAGMNIGAPVAATDDDDTVLTYTLDAGTDAASFDIDAATGQLMAKGEIDFEDAANPDDQYVVTVTATDPSGADADATVTINVTDVNEAPEFDDVDDQADPPANIKGMADDHREDNDDLAIATFTATDREGANVSLSLSGDDMDKFDLSGGTLSFEEAPDFEMPGDDNGDNIYEVTVIASDGSNQAMRSLTVKVTDWEEAGKATLSTQDARIGTPIMAELEDSDGGVTDIEWQWHRIGATGNIPELNDTNEIEDATDATYTPDDDDNNMRLVVMASYTDRTYAGTPDPLDDDADATAMMFTNTARSMATTVVRDDPANKAPEFKDSTTQRFVMENTAEGMNIGMPVTAKENDTGQTVTYSLSGADRAAFDIDAVDDPAATPAAEVAGQIKTKADLNYEDKKRYTVTVTATDSSGESNDSDTITVTIYVTDVDEKPEIMVVPTENQAPMFPSSSTERSIPEGQSSGRAIGSRVTATDPNPGDSLTYTLEGTDAASFSIHSGTGQLRTSAPLVRDTKSSYMVTVKATDRDGLSDTITVTITVTEMEEQMGEVTLWDGTDRLTTPPQVGDTITGAVEDDDDGVTVESWQWSRSMDKNSWMDIDGATNAAYMVTADDTGYYLRVMATYMDAVGTDTAMEDSPATMMVGAEAEEMTPLEEYDGDKDGWIQLDEARVAVGDYFRPPKGTHLSLADAREVVGLYFEYKNSQSQ